MATELKCAKHAAPLWPRLKGGVGYCGECGQYVRAAGIPEPELPPKPAPQGRAQGERESREARYATASAAATALRFEGMLRDALRRENAMAGIL